jgi:hypothetical protein
LGGDALLRPEGVKPRREDDPQTDEELYRQMESGIAVGSRLEALHARPHDSRKQLENMKLKREQRSGSGVTKPLAYFVVASFISELIFFLLFLNSYSVAALENSGLFFPGSPVSGAYAQSGQLLSPLIYKAWVTLGIWTTVNVDLLLSALVLHFRK